MVSHEAVPLIAGFGGELFLHLHLADSTHHAGKGVENHLVPEGERGDRVVLELSNGSLAGEAGLEPVGVVLTLGEFF